PGGEKHRGARQAGRHGDLAVPAGTYAATLAKNAARLPRPESRAMTKEIRLNAFDMNCVGHIQHGMWTHPRDRSTAYNTIEYWQDLARLAERGKFDGIFLADIVGVYDVYRGGPAPSIVDDVQIPVNQPMMVVPVMAARRAASRRTASAQPAA